MRRMLRTYRVLVKNELAARMAYRLDFMMGVIVALASEMLLPMITMLIYSAGAAFPGWDYYEVLIIQSIFIMATAVANTLFFGMVGIVMEHIREGTFDLFMIKPAPPAMLAVGMSFSLDGVFVFLGGLGLFLFSLHNQFASAASDAPGLFAWIQFILVFLMAVAVLLGFTFIMSATMFKWVGNSRLFEIFQSLAQFGRYPASVYPKVFKSVITYVVPVALLGSIPASVLLKPDGSVGLLLALVFAAVFLGVGYTVWRLMLRAYTSTGG